MITLWGNGFCTYLTFKEFQVILSIQHLSAPLVCLCILLLLSSQLYVRVYCCGYVWLYFLPWVIPFHMFLCFCPTATVNIHNKPLTFIWWIFINSFWFSICMLSIGIKIFPRKTVNSFEVSGSWNTVFYIENNVQNISTCILRAFGLV